MFGNRRLQDFSLSWHRSLLIVSMLSLCISAQFRYVAGSKVQRQRTLRNRLLQTNSTRNDLVELVPFDVRIVLTENNGIQILDVSNIVTSWMNDAFAYHLDNLGFDIENNYASFQAVVLLKRQDTSDNNESGKNSNNSSNNRYLERILQPDKDRDDNQKGTESPAPTERTSKEPSASPVIKTNDDDDDGKDRNNATGEEYTAKFKGGVYFLRKSNAAQLVPQKDIVVIQQMTFFNTSELLKTLQSSPSDGLGISVVDVRVVLDAVADDDSISSETNEISGNEANSSKNQSEGTDAATKQLEKVIIAAISVAVSAFLFLLAAIYWAYRYDKKNRDAYLINNSSVVASGVGSNDQPKQKGTFDRTEAEETNSPHQSVIETSPVKTIYQVRYPNNHNGYPLEIGGASVIGNPVYAESVMSDSVVSDHRSLSDFGAVVNNGPITSDDEGAYDDNNVQNTPTGSAKFGVKNDYETTNSVLMNDDDVSASLSQYYNSGMGKIGSPVPIASPTGLGNNDTTITEGIEMVDPPGSVTHSAKTSTQRLSQQQHLISDLASVSSMESYGFSLDGTVPTIMSPSNNPYSRSGSSNHNTKSMNSYVNQNSYTSRLERIGGLPVEPDLRNLENLTIDDIDINSAIETITDSKISAAMNQILQSTTTTTNGGNYINERQQDYHEYDSNNRGGNDNHNNNNDNNNFAYDMDENDEDEYENDEDGTIGAENDLCTIDGSFAMPFK